jgi:hypothetical protein
MIRLILLAAILGFLWYGYKKIQTMPLDQKRKTWWKIGLGALVVISLLAVAAGRLHWLGGALAVLLALLKFGAGALFRLWPLLRATGKDAVFRTDFLEVRFVVRTSELQGTVIYGPHAGEQLQTMDAATLQELAEHYRDKDRRSFYLVQAFLKRAGASQFTGGEDRYQSTQQAFSNAPSRDEALLILGLEGKPDKNEIITAHRRLIQKLHPDRGGNDYLASRINQAKEVLLRSL